MLDSVQIQKNKELFCKILNDVDDREGMDSLINWLSNKSDFFTAPATTKYHHSYEGGLCEQALKTYDYITELYSVIHKTTVMDKQTSHSLIIVSLLHNISRANFYETYNRNVKNEVTGKWEQVQEYRVKEDRFLYGSLEQNAEFMISSFIPLTIEERVAILHSSGGTNDDSVKENIAPLYVKYPLVLLLHEADMLSSYIQDKDE